MRIGNAIKQIRTEKGYNQKELAELCDISAAYLSQIENNKRQPTIDLIEEISSKLGIPLPVILFLSLGELDISEEKREMFKLLNPSVTKLINDIFLTAND